MYLSTMEREHDGTSIVLLVLSPGISNVEALTNAIDLLAETCEVSQQQQQQQQQRPKQWTPDERRGPRVLHGGVQKIA